MIVVEVHELHRAIRELLARMEVLSEAQTTRLQSSPGKSKPGPKILRHNGPPLHDLWHARFAAHYHDKLALERLLHAGRAALELRRHGPPKIHDTLESEDFILTNYEGVDPETVALIESERGALCRPAYVIWLRRQNDRTDMGHPGPFHEGRQAMAQRLRAEGRNQAWIAKEMRVSQSTVSRWLNDTRKKAA